MILITPDNDIPNYPISLRPIADNKILLEGNNWVNIGASQSIILLEKFDIESSIYILHAEWKLISAAVRVPEGRREWLPANKKARNEYAKTGKIKGWIVLVFDKTAWMSEYDVETLKELGDLES
jgi:hypothetical protein